MAKTTSRVLRKPAERVLGQTREEMLRGLELEGLTQEECLRGLFGDVVDEAEAEGEGITVTQVGPGRRRGSST